MVGYHPDDLMTTHQVILAGSLSGVLTRFVTQPLDVLKIRIQLQKQSNVKQQRSLLETAKSILREEGITAFWHGHALGQLHSILSVSTQFYVYELSTRYAVRLVSDEKYKLFVKFFCGIVSGACAFTVITPLEVIRVRQMLIKEQYKGIFQGAKAVYKSGGPLAFFEGWSAGVLMMGPQMGITFSVFSFIQPLILNAIHPCNSACTHSSANAHKPSHLVVASSVAAGIAGFLAKLTTYPLDLARRRLQIASHKTSKEVFTPSTSKHLIKCTRLIQCITDTYKSEGIKGLYRGLEVTIYKTQLFNVITFTSYEFICYFIRELNK